MCEARHLSVFDKLNHEELEELDEKKGCRFYRKNQVIFNEGSHSNRLYCVKKGQIKISKTGVDGREQIIHFAKAGDVMGYRALLAGEAYSATATAIDDCTICFIPRSELLNLLERNTALGMKFMLLLCHKVEELGEQATSLSHRTVRERLAQSLLLLKQAFGLKEDGKTLDVQLSREDLASFVGTATESLIRMLSEFKDEGVVELSGKKIVLKDILKLVRISRIGF